MSLIEALIVMFVSLVGLAVTFLSKEKTRNSYSLEFLSGNWFMRAVFVGALIYSLSKIVNHTF